MPKFTVIVSRERRCPGSFEIEAESLEAAEAHAKSLMDSYENPLQTTDTRIDWDEEGYYIDNSFVLDEVMPAE